MPAFTQISLISVPGVQAEPAPLRRQAQLLRSADGRAVVTFVSWLASAESTERQMPARGAPGSAADPVRDGR
jgi:hypothetical protein